MTIETDQDKYMAMLTAQAEEAQERVPFESRLICIGGGTVVVRRICVGRYRMLEIEVAGTESPTVVRLTAEEGRDFLDGICVAARLKGDDGQPAP